MIVVHILFIGLLSTLFTLAIHKWVRKLPISRHFAKINDIVGFYVNLIGVIYAVILTFMLISVWEDYMDTNRIVEAEATALTKMYHLADGMSDPLKTTIKGATRDFAAKAIEEWPEMAAGTRPIATEIPSRTLWEALTTYEPQNIREQILLEELLSARLALHESREQRLNEATHRLPGILWFCLIFGGFITIGLCFLFGVEQTGIHQFKTTLTASFIMILLLTTWELNRPFHGQVSVTPEAFEIALQELGQKE